MEVGLMARWRQLFKTEKEDRILFTAINIASLSSLSITVWDIIVLQQGIFRFRWLSLVGLLLFSPGLIIYLVSRMTLGKQFTKPLTIVEGHKLITHGIYKHVRHPSYTGSILFFLGLPLLFNSVLGFIIVPPMIFLVLLRIPVEENMLIREFGEEYIEYVKRSKKLIPLVY